MSAHRTIIDRLRDAGHALPPAMPAVASYVPFVCTGRPEGVLVHVAGQGPFRDGALEFVGRIGAEIDHRRAMAASELVTLNVLAQADAAANSVFGAPSLHRVRCLRLGIFLNCIDGFTAMEAISDAASRLVLLALGEMGRHCRTVAGKPVLPMQTSVEIDGLFLLDGSR